LLQDLDIRKILECQGIKKLSRKSRKSFKTILKYKCLGKLSAAEKMLVWNRRWLKLTCRKYQVNSKKVSGGSGKFQGK